MANDKTTEAVVGERSPSPTRERRKPPGDAASKPCIAPEVQQNHNRILITKARSNTTLKVTQELQTLIGDQGTKKQQRQEATPSSNPSTSSDINKTTRTPSQVPIKNTKEKKTDLSASTAAPRWKDPYDSPTEESEDENKESDGDDFDDGPGYGTATKYGRL